MKKESSKFTKSLVLSQLLVCSSLLLFAGKQVAANEINSNDRAATTELEPKETPSPSQLDQEENFEELTPVTVASTETKTSVQNVLEGKAPTTNSQELIASELSTIPSVAIKNPVQATDGSTSLSSDEGNKAFL